MSAYAPSTDEERAMDLALRNSIAIARFRKRAGLPPHPTPRQVATWHALLNLRWLMTAWRKNHRTPQRAA